MNEYKPGQDQKVSEDLGSWESAERESRLAFQNRSPGDRLAWLEDVLILRAAVILAKATSAGR